MKELTECLKKPSSVRSVETAWVSERSDLPVCKDSCVTMQRVGTEVNGNVNIHEVQRVGNMCRRRLTPALMKVRNLITYCSMVKHELNSYLEKLSIHLNEITDEIIQKANALPVDTETATDKLISQIQNEHTVEENRIDANIKEFDEFLNKSKQLAIKIENIINASSDDNESDNVTSSDDVTEQVARLETALPQSPVERCLYVLSPPQKDPKGDDGSSEELLGDFSKTSVPWRIEVKRIGSFRPEVASSNRLITSMSAAEDEHAWVVWMWGPLIHLIDKDGKIKRTVDAKCKVDDICTDFDGNLVISSHETRTIKILNENYELEKTIHLNNVPRGVHFTSKDELVACCVQNLHHKNGDTSSVVRIRPEADDTFHDLTSTEHFIQPWRIAVNQNGDICVSDRNKGAVLIFDNNGTLKAVYSGPDTSTRHPFAPHGVSCDKYGQTYVVDYANHTVHVLDPLGRFRGFLIMDTELEKRAIFMGTSSPFSIAIDDAGDVWVGNKFGYLTVLKCLC